MSAEIDRRTSRGKRLGGHVGSAKRPPVSAPARNLDVTRLAAHHRLMWRIRAFEEQALQALADRLVLGAIHPSIGQEAVAAGVCANLRRDDVLLSTHRGHGHTLAKGADPLAMMRELFGREGGNCGGKGGSMHIADFDVGMLGANGVVGANIVIAAGAAHAIKLKREPKVVCCIFGDGAINRGPFLEGLNWAKVFGLPVLFVCEDNGFAATTRTKTMTAGEGPSARARSMGLPAVEIDGNDVVAVDAAAREMIEAVRGGGPRFLHVHTYRLTGHTGADPATYRPKQEVEERWRDDPIARAASLLEGAGVDGLASVQEEAVAEMRRVYDTARDTPYPPVENAYADVQDVGDPQREAF
jgi:pyruvate dehydrogenase E1 component alpha subunit